MKRLLKELFFCKENNLALVDQIMKLYTNKILSLKDILRMLISILNTKMLKSLKDQKSF
jgi:hypothetical protein